MAKKSEEARKARWRNRQRKKATGITHDQRYKIPIDTLPLLAEKELVGIQVVDESNIAFVLDLMERERREPMQGFIVILTEEEEKGGNMGELTVLKEVPSGFVYEVSTTGTTLKHVFYPHGVEFRGCALTKGKPRIKQCVVGKPLIFSLLDEGGGIIFHHNGEEGIVKLIEGKEVEILRAGLFPQVPYNPWLCAGCGEAIYSEQEVDRHFQVCPSAQAQAIREGGIIEIEFRDIDDYHFKCPQCGGHRTVHYRDYDFHAGARCQYCGLPSQIIGKFLLEI